MRKQQALSPEPSCLAQESLHLAKEKKHIKSKPHQCTPYSQHYRVWSLKLEDHFKFQTSLSYKLKPVSKTPPSNQKQKTYLLVFAFYFVWAETWCIYQFYQFMFFLLFRFFLFCFFVCVCVPGQGFSGWSWHCGSGWPWLWDPPASFSLPVAHTQHCPVPLLAFGVGVLNSEPRTLYIRLKTYFTTPKNMCFQESPRSLVTTRWPNYRVIISLGKQTLQAFNMVFPGAGISTGSLVDKSSAKTFIPRKGLVKWQICTACSTSCSLQVRLLRQNSRLQSYSY